MASAPEVPSKSGVRPRAAQSGAAARAPPRPNGPTQLITPYSGRDLCSKVTPVILHGVVSPETRADAMDRRGGGLPPIDFFSNSTPNASSLAIVTRVAGVPRS